MLLGIIEAVWNGTNLPLKPGSSFELGGLTSKPQVVGNDVDFSNATEPSNITLKMAVKKGAAIYAMFPAGVPGELQIQCDTGQTYVWAYAFRMGTIKVSTGDNSEAEINLSAGVPLEQINQ